MNPQSALSVIRDQLNETSATFWSDAEIYNYMTVGENVLAARTGGIVASTTHTSVTDTSVYTLPADLLRINRLTYDGKKLRRVKDVDIDWLDGTTYGSTANTGSPEVYRESGNEVTVYPTPDSDKPIIFEITKNAAQITTDSTLFTILNAAIHQNVIPYSCWKAYQKAGELTMSDRYKSEFDEGVLLAVSAQRDQENWDDMQFVRDEDQYAGGSLGMD